MSNAPLRSPFVDASGLLSPNGDELNYGCVMADLDRDGMNEILVLGVAAPNRLYKWRGDRLVDVAPPALADEENNGIGVACGDMTGNGFLDVYLLNTTAFLGPESDPDRLLVNNGNLRFEDLFAKSKASNFGAGRSVVWLDVDGSGRLACYVCNYAEPCRLFSLEKTGLANIAPALGLNQVTGGRSAVAVDLFGSGRIDLFTANENDANKLFRNEGNRRFVECARPLGLADATNHARGLVAADFDRDGRIDLCWGNWEGPHRLMMQQPDGTFRNTADARLARPSRVRTVIAFDYDNDGWEDLFFNNIGQANRLFHNNGDGTFSEVDLGDLALDEGLGTGATVGDLNNDGFLDLFISHGESAPMPNALMLNTPNGNHWLRVHAQTPAGAPAVGARVVVFVPGDARPMTRFIDGGSGYLCQMEPVAHFGLGKSEAAARVEIRFTTGHVWRGEDIPANHHLVVRRNGDDWFVGVSDEPPSR